MSVAVSDIPGLAGLPPGPALAAALADLDFPTVSNEHVVAVVQAQHRQVSHEQGRLLGAIVELGRATPFSDPDDPHLRAVFGTQRLAAVREHASAELAAALTLTSRAADSELHFADTVVTHLPLVHAGLLAGLIDRPKAWVFAEHLADDLTPVQVATICAALVPAAPRLTTGQLRARLQRMIHDIDPGHARRRYRAAIRQRAVVGYLAPDGTATVTATGLPADQAITACERLDTLAHRIQQAGHPGRLGQIQTDLFLGLLDGTLHHLTEPQIIAHLLTHPRPEDTDSPTRGADPARSPGPEGSGVEGSGVEGSGVEDSGVEDSGVEDSEVEDSEVEDSEVEDSEVEDSEVEDSEVEDSEVEDSEVEDSEVEDSEVEDSEVEDSEVEDSEVEDSGGQAGATPDQPAPPARPAPPQPGPATTAHSRTGVEVRIALTTLLGLDDRAGEIPGHGPLLPDPARRLVAAQHRGAHWRFAVTDPDGHLLHAGTTRHRPNSPAAEQGRCTGGIVEIHIDADRLHHLATTQPDPAWAAVIADLAHQYTDRDTATTDLDQQPRHRFARGALARHIEVRDRTCCFPGCRRPAHRCDLDHTHDHAHGGPTTTTNIGPLCGRHHREKTEHGWQLIQPEPGRYCWTSPLGQRYRTRGEPINPPTVPTCPRAAVDDPAVEGSTWIEGPTFLRRPALAATPPTPRPPPSDDEPPF